MPAPHSTRARPAPRGGGFRGEPNPLLVRELRQSLRLQLLPWAMAAMIVIVGLSMLAVGSQASHGDRSSSELGTVLFQGFLAVLLVYVALIGPATAASAIASEREGKTLEPLLLTSLSARDVARGKFLAAYATIGIQAVTMLPLAAIPFLFGGVGAAELAVGVVYVSAFAAAAVGLGLALASRAQSLRGALAVAIVLPAVSLPLFFATAAALGSGLARGRWAFLPSGPFWWSSAYASVPFGLDYALWLILWPLVALGLPIWLFYVVAATNLSGPSEDRSTPVKRWFIAAATALSIAIDFTCLRVEATHAPAVAAIGMVVTLVLALTMATMIAGEPIVPSRLVRARWERTGASALTRAIGPGLLRGVLLFVGLIVAMAAACFVGGSFGASQGALRRHLGWMPGEAAPTGGTLGLAVLGTYVVMYAVFLFGFAAWLRTRQRAVQLQTARAWLVAVALLSTLVPWLLSAIARGFLDEPQKAMLVAAPSPAFGVTAFLSQLSLSGDDASTVMAAFTAALGWGFLGMVLIAISWERARRSAGRAAKAEREEQERLDEEADEEAAEEEEAAVEPTPAPPQRA